MLHQLFRFSVLIGLIFTIGCGYNASLKKGTVIAEKGMHVMPVSYEKGLLFVEVFINGQKKRFIIDSGAPNVVDDDLRQALNLKKVTETGFKDSGSGSSRNEIVKIKS